MHVPHRLPHFAKLPVTLLAVIVLGACSTTTLTPVSTTTVDSVATTTVAPEVADETLAYPAIDAGEVAQWVPEILGEIDHDPAAFTQGLIVDDGTVFESTGLYGESSVRELDRTTGEVLRQEPLAPELFGEGLELVDDRLVQLTWQEETLVVWGRDDFVAQDPITYEGEGWGLCLDDDVLVMSDGSSQLTMRDPQSFAELSRVEVTLDGAPRDMLNELECVDGWVFSNVWMTNDIVVIDPDSGEIVAVIDASSLDAEVADAPDRDVLNGIAYDPDTDTFLVTGKLWPTIFEVRFVKPTP